MPSKCHSSLDSRSILFPKAISESKKQLKFYWKNKHLLSAGDLKITSLLHAILVSTRRHFGCQNPSKSRLGSVLGAFGTRLEASWSHLGPSWARLGAVLARFGSFWGVLDAF